MGQIAADQSQQVMATLMTNCPWGEIDFEKSGLQDSIIRNPKQAGLDFAEWLRTRRLSKQTVVEENGIIKLPPIVGLGLANPQQRIDIVSSAGHELSDWAKSILLSPNFVPCEKDKVYHPVILPGKLFSGAERTTTNVRARGDSLGLNHGVGLPTELGILIRLNYTNEEIERMGLDWLVTMHEPVKDSDGDPVLLGTIRGGGKSWLNAIWGNPDLQWYREFGFVFLASQVSPQD